MDVLDLKASALARAAKVLRAGGELSAKPIYSKVRFVANMAPVMSCFESATVHTEGAGEPRAFDYRRGAVASVAGFGASTTASQRHTNIITEGEVPNGGDALIVGFQLRAHALRKPITTNSVDAIANDSTSTSKPARDGLADSGAVSSVQALILEMIADNFVPYFQRTGKQKEYLPPLKWIREGRSGFVAHYLDPVGWVVGPNEKFAFGFERKGAVTFAAKATDPLFWAIVDTGLDVTTADSTINPVIQDVTVETIGARFDPKAGA